MTQRSHCWAAAQAWYCFPTGCKILAKYK